ncbi:MAG: efflux RND transporter permease subunit [Stenotrophobium sp.]
MALTSRGFLRFIEPLIYGRRGRVVSAICIMATTLLLLIQALQIRPDPGFDKSIPLQHPYMQVFKQYQAQFGGANSLLVALIQKHGDIYNPKFLTELKAATDEVFFLPSIDRAHVSSLFTPDVRYYEVVPGGFGGGANVVPVEYTPTPEMIARVRANVAKAGIIGRLVTEDQHGAMIFADVLENDPRTGKTLDYVKVAHAIEDTVRRRFTSRLRYEYRLKHAIGPFKAGEVVAEHFSKPDWNLWFEHFEATRGSEDQLQKIRYSGRDLIVTAQPNPQYNPDVEIHIIGFTPMIGDVADATFKVAGFFVLTVFGTMLALWWYLRSFRLALLPMTCSLVAVVWEFGLLRLFGYGVDPFAILVPFLVLAVSTSHGVQYVNTWADEVMHGRNSYDGSVETFRRLFVPGMIALVTNVAGFLTIYQVPIDIIREMSVNACLGMFAVMVTNKVMMPIWLSYLRLRDVDAFRRTRLQRQHASDRLWAILAHVTDGRVATVLLLCSAVGLGISLWKQGDRIIGDAQDGVPELRPDSVYNRDTRAITGNFAIGVDELKVIAETDANACIHYNVLDQIDRYAWHMRNTPGVSSVMAMPQLLRTVYSAFSDGAIKFQVLPRNQNVNVLLNSKITTQSGLLNWDCTAMPVRLFTTDHKAATIDGIVAASDRFDHDNAADFFLTHKDVDAAYCAAKWQARRQWGLAAERLQHYSDQLSASGMSDDAVQADAQHRALQRTVDDENTAKQKFSKVCPVHFALALGNVGVMAATNQVVRDKELSTVLWVYAVIAVCLLLAYRSWIALLAICVPLLLVSVFANALMAVFGIGLKVATLPVVALAVGIGVDYGIYFYDVIQREMREQRRNLHDAYFEALRQTGKAVIFTGVCLAGGVATWLWSDLQFQRDMGLLLVFMFTANMLGAVLLCPALCRLLMHAPAERKL